MPGTASAPCLYHVLGQVYPLALLGVPAGLEILLSQGGQFDSTPAAPGTHALSATFIRRFMRP